MEENYKDIFKKHFDNHHEDIDPQVIWENVKPKKKRRFFWLILNSLLALMAGSALFFAFQNDRGIDELFVTQSLEFAIEENTEEASNNLKEEKVTAAINRNNQAKSELVQTEERTQKTPKATVPTFTEVRKQKEIKQKEIKQKIKIREEAKAELFTNEKRETESFSDIASELNQALPNKDTTFKKIGQEVIEPSYGINSTSEIETFNNLAILQFKLFDIKARVLPVLDNETLKYKPKDFKKTSNYFSIGVNGSYGFLQVDRLTNGSGNEQLLAARENTVKKLEAARFNLLTNFHLGSRISLSSGLQYTRLNELFTWQGIYERETAGQYVTEIVQTTEETFTTYTEGEFDETVERNMRIYNKTNLMSIPFLVNLHQSVGLFTFSVGGGLEANVMQWRDGFVLNNSNIPVALEDQEQAIFDLNYIGKLGIEYNLNDDLNLAVNFGYTQIKQRETNINTEFGVIELGIGLRYAMGK